MKCVIRKVTFGFISLLFTLQIQAQIGGIAGTKINSFNGLAISKGALEFEPTLTHSRSNGQWDDNGDYSKNQDLTTLNTQLQWRFSYGIFENIGVGATIDNQLSYASIGARYSAFDKEKWSLSLLTGANTSLGNSIFPSDIFKVQWAMGFGSTFIINGQSDVDFSYLITTGNNNISIGHFPTIEYGYRTKKNIVWIAGVGYQYTNVFQSSQSKWTFYPGVSIESANNFVLVLSIPIDYLGRNMAKTRTVNMTITALLD